MKVKNESEVAQSCPTLSDPMDCSPPGSSIHEIFQARVLERGLEGTAGFLNRQRWCEGKNALDGGGDRGPAVENRKRGGAGQRLGEFGWSMRSMPSNCRR